MSNVRLLRQSLEDYNSRIAKLDTQYQSDYEKYQADVTAYNAEVAAHPVDARWGTVRYNIGEEDVMVTPPPDSESGQVYAPQLTRQIKWADKPTELPVPVAPSQTFAPRSPNLTNNDYKALANPGTDPAGVVRDNNKGYTGNSTIAALNDTPMRNSAFSDPEDPQGLKERGILARTLGGQL